MAGWCEGSTPGIGLFEIFADLSRTFPAYILERFILYESWDSVAWYFAMQMLFQHIKTLILPALLACVMMLCGLFSASAALTNGIGTVYGFYIGPSVDLTGANLGYADLTGANLAGATLVNAILTRANFTSADLTNANLTGAYLAVVNLTGAYLTGANFNKAKILDSDLTSANLTGANLINAIYDSNTIWPAGFSYQTSGAIGPNAILTNANLSGFPLSGVDLTGANLAGANLTNAIYDSQTIWPVGFSYQKSGAFGPNADFSYANLSGVNLAELDLTSVNFSYANLTNAYLFGTKFPLANLSFANLDGANLTYANLTYASLPNANLTGANLTYATLFYNNLVGANFSKANLTGANLNLATLTGANLANADLTGVDLSNATLTGANLNLATLTGANLFCATFTNAILTGANLTNAYLYNADLTGVDLSNANLTGANLIYANFTNAIYSTKTVWPDGFDFLHAGMLGPGVNFKGENLSSNDLSGIDFTGACFTNCNLTGCDFSGCVLLGANFTGAKMNGVNLTKALIGAGTLFPKGVHPDQAVRFVSPLNDQTITFPKFSVAYGDSPILLKATANSHLRVTYLSGNTNVASISNNYLLIQGIGTTTVSALQYGDSKYRWASPVTRELIVSKGKQSIIFQKIPAHTEGDADFELFAASSDSGENVTFTSSNTKVATVFGDTVTILKAGTTTITASVASDAFYNAARSVSRVLIVRPVAKKH